MKTTSADIALEFIDRINSHDLALLCGLITEDHVLIDAQGRQFHGKREMERSWRACFEWFPDYSIQVDQAFANGNLAVITGCVMGTYLIHGRLSRENRWKTPSAWQATIRKEEIAEWRVYADNEPIWKIMHEKRYAGGKPVQREPAPFRQALVNHRNAP
ncbi:ketosteroid isomerase-like protein [Silvibacterium bohemicum]|uniref:Ketosteroid isomerase-like protein n=1 Tax=Silvibacterium bohemicum TaxID=1577686 RepID=A0A841JU04_9BACT|nr:nuclear transport factor 2 family protein [Silvibacterium bohemicum]MBB6144882.1 ketosteroid isomerase-like protein [Silvibacterium bohemicum]